MTQGSKLGVVFDCNVYLQAVVSEGGPSARAVRFAEEGRITLFVSKEIIEEIRDVLTRPKLRAQFAHLTDKRMEALLQFLLDRGVFVEESPPVFQYERDPKDEKYIHLALAAKARYLVSRDKDLLDLAKDATFRQRYPDLTILNPVSFLQELEGQSGN